MVGYGSSMAHLIKDKKKLISRVKRIKGQLGSVEKALDEVHDCAQILQTIAACRGALDSLMSEIFEGHIRMHIIDPERHPTSDRRWAPSQATRNCHLFDTLWGYSSEREVRARRPPRSRSRARPWSPRR